MIMALSGELLGLQRKAYTETGGGTQHWMTTLLSLVTVKVEASWWRYCLCCIARVRSAPDRCVYTRRDAL
jgi:hypothetical protein